MWRAARQFRSPTPRLDSICRARSSRKKKGVPSPPRRNCVRPAGRAGSPGAPVESPPGRHEEHPASIIDAQNKTTPANRAGNAETIATPSVRHSNGTRKPASQPLIADSSRAACPPPVDGRPTPDQMGRTVPNGPFLSREDGQSARHGKRMDALGIPNHLTGAGTRPPSGSATDSSRIGLCTTP